MPWRISKEGGKCLAVYKSKLSVQVRGLDLPSKSDGLLFLGLRVGPNFSCTRVLPFIHLANARLSYKVELEKMDSLSPSNPRKSLCTSEETNGLDVYRSGDEDSG